MRKRFIIIQILIYLSFLVIDIFAEDAWLEQLSVLLKLSAIALCFLYVMVMHYKFKTKDTLLMCIVFLFTLTSDVFLLLTRYFLIGVVFFIFVQVLYAYRITSKAKRLLKLSVFAALALGLTIFYIVNPEAGYGGLLEVGIIYAVLFLWNIIELARADGGRFANKRFFLVGLVLYAICDLHVLIYNFPSYFQSNEALQMWYDFSAIGMWLFYLPGQVLLGMSAQGDGESVSRDSGV